MSDVVLVTGGAKRIGREICLYLSSCGFDIVIHHSNSDVESVQLAEKIQKFGQKAFIIKSDFSNLVNLETDLARIPDDLEINYLINNAAIFESQTFQDTTLVDWDRHLSVNLTAPFLVSQWFVKRLSPDAHAKIINILDWRAFRPQTDHFPYTISKAALAAMTKALALSLAPLVSVNGIAFGAILPPSDGTPPEKMLNAVPFGRTATMDEVCKTVQFLLQGPDYITGEFIHLDGGRHLV